MVGGRGVEVSAMGRVHFPRQHRTTWGWLKAGYYFIRVNGKEYRVHRLVAAVWLPNPLGLPEVHHKDVNG